MNDHLHLSATDFLGKHKDRRILKVHRTRHFFQNAFDQKNVGPPMCWNIYKSHSMTDYAKVCQIDLKSRPVQSIFQPIFFGCFCLIDPYHLIGGMSVRAFFQYQETARISDDYVVQNLSTHRFLL